MTQTLVSKMAKVGVCRSPILICVRFLTFCKKKRCVRACVGGGWVRRWLAGWLGVCGVVCVCACESIAAAGFKTKAID